MRKGKSASSDANGAENLSSEQSVTEFFETTECDFNKKRHIFSEIFHAYTNAMIKTGMIASKLIAGIARAAANAVKRAAAYSSKRLSPLFSGLATNLKLFVVLLCMPFISLIRCRRTVRDRFELISESFGKKEARRDSLHTTGKIIWGSRRHLVTLCNYAAPVLSIVFLASLVSYASQLEYAVNIEFNGQDLGFISLESDVDEAEMEVQKRISYVDGNEMVSFTPKLSIRVVNDSSVFIDTSELADKMIINSESELTNAYGFYIDDEFYGAVTETGEIESELAAMLSEYSSNGYGDVAFVKKTSFTEGLYLADSVVDSAQIITMLRGSTEANKPYTIAEGDTPETIAQTYAVDVNELLSLNPVLSESCIAGIKIEIPGKESFMPIAYSVLKASENEVPYESINIDDNTLARGKTKVKVKGANGKTKTVDKITYVDGNETARETVSTEVLVEPVTEQISVGTAVEQYPSSYYNGVVDADGSGNFIRPIAGGYVSCFFGSGGHKGIDIAGIDFGTDIHAADAGTVIVAGSHPSYGNYVMIDHGNGFVTLYAHASSLCVTAGQKVASGDLIAHVGNTGNSYGKHLHFEIRYNNAYTNPLYYVSQY